MRKIVKVLFVLLFISSLTTVVASCEEQYNHIWSAESPDPQSGLWFGYQIAISEDRIIFSAPKAKVEDYATAGKAYIYDLDGELIKTLQSPEPGSDYDFGRDLDLHNGLITIFESTHFNGIKWVGQVHFFDSNGIYQFALKPDEFRKYSNFGRFLAIGDDLLLIWERGVELSPPSPGMVHIYKRDGEYVNTIYSPEPKTGTDKSFGSSMEIGAEHIYLAQDESVYIYDFEGVLVNTIQAPEPAPAWTAWNGSFGNCIDVSDDVLVIGEMDARVNSIDRVGKVHIYNTDGEYLRTLISPKPDFNAKFGSSVAISGDIIVVGEEWGNIDPFMEEGRAYVFNVDGTLIQNLSAPDPSPRGAFGLDVDIQDDIIVVGECWAEVEGQSDCGRIHVYKLGAPVETHESVEEGTTVVSETGSDSEPSGGIPGYPLWSIGLALLLVSIVISRTQKQ